MSTINEAKSVTLNVASNITNLYQIVKEEDKAAGVLRDLLTNYYQINSYGSCLRRYIYHVICKNGTYKNKVDGAEKTIQLSRTTQNNNGYEPYYHLSDDANKNFLLTKEYKIVLFMDAERRGFYFDKNNPLISEKRFNAIKKRFDRQFINMNDIKKIKDLSKDYIIALDNLPLNDLLPEDMSLPRLNTFITETAFFLNMNSVNLKYFLDNVFYDYDIVRLDEFFANVLIDNKMSNVVGYMTLSSFKDIVQKNIQDDLFMVAKNRVIISHTKNQNDDYEREHFEQEVKERYDRLINDFRREFIDKNESVYLYVKSKYGNSDDKAEEISQMFLEQLKIAFAEISSFERLNDRYFQRLLELYQIQKNYIKEARKFRNTKSFTKRKLKQIAITYIDTYNPSTIRDSETVDQVLLYKNSYILDSLLPMNNIDMFQRYNFSVTQIKRKHIMILEFYKYALAFSNDMVKYDDTLEQLKISDVDVEIPASVARFIKHMNLELAEKNFAPFNIKNHIDKSILIAASYQSKMLEHFMELYDFRKDD